MTPDAIESEPRIWIRKRGLVIVDTLSFPDFCPVPTILRALAVFNHDGPAVDFFRWLKLVSRCRRRILFLHDHRAIGNHTLWIVLNEPFDDKGRVIDLDSWVNAVAGAVDEWPSVAKPFVFTPLQLLVFPIGDKRFELRLKLGKTGRKERARKRQATFRFTGAR